MMMRSKKKAPIMVLINSMKLLFNVYPSELEVNLLIYFKCIQTIKGEQIN